MAKRVSSILKKHNNIKNLIFDTTGVGYFELKGKKAPEIANINAALQKGRAGRVRISKLKEVEVEKADIVYEVSVAGLG